MFETIDNLSPSNQQTNTPQGSPPPRLRPIQPDPLQSARVIAPLSVNQAPPKNLPIGGPALSLPEDIFGNFAPDGSAQAPKAPYFQPQPTAGLSAATAQDGAPTALLQNPGEPPSSLPTTAPGLEKSSSARKALVFLLSALIVALLFIGGYLAYKIFVAQKPTLEVQNVPFPRDQSESVAQPQQTNKKQDASLEPLPQVEGTDAGGGNSTEPVPTEDVTPKPEPEPEPAPAPEPNQPPEDTDNDGLTDLEELQIGSNPRVRDTDLDGLDDYSEVKVYHTNPVKRDTDGDGYDDGTEVKNGYNPLGPGKL